MDTKSWRDEDLTVHANRLARQGQIDKTLGLMALSMVDNEASFDAGFEAGVLATEACVGRAYE